MPPKGHARASEAGLGLAGSNQEHGGGVGGELREGKRHRSGTFKLLRGIWGSLGKNGECRESEQGGQHPS